MKISIIYSILIFIAFSGCRKMVLEDDITDKKVKLIAPADSTITIDPNIQFWWNELEGAEGYTLQVAKPSFDSTQIQKILLDTNINSTYFEHTLSTGTFAWRVIGYNGGYKTKDNDHYTLIIDSTSGLYPVTLRSPADNYATPDSAVTFQWDMHPNADSYRFEIYKGDQMAANPQLLEGTEISFPDNTLGLPTLEEGTYVWKVQAQKSTYPPADFVSRAIYIDRTSPGRPTLSSPDDNEVINSTPVTLTWNRPDDSGSPIKDSIYVYADSLFNNVVESAYSSSTSYTVSLEVNDSYFWEVRSIDAAGNKSNYSVLRKYTIDK